MNNGTIDADIDTPEAWDLTTGSTSVVVAVIDSGIDYNHEDLKANMWRNPGEISGSNWNKLADVDASILTYMHRRLELNQTYSYALVSVNNAGIEGTPAYLTINNE